MKRLKVLAILVVLFSQSCTFRSFDSATKSETDEGIRAEMTSNWKVVSQPTYKVQKGCEPLHLKVPAGVRTKGSIMMFHGLSACPQQYEIWGEKLTALGYQIFVPLLPGHGKVPLQTEPRKDDISELPLQPVKFDDFAEKMARFFAKEPQERLLLGTSLGGTYALDVASQMPSDAPVQRVAALVPMLGITNLLSLGVVLYKTCAHLPIICGKYSNNQNILNFGDGCEKVEMPKGRAGYCQFMTQHVDAMVDYSKQIQKKLNALAKSLKSTKFLFIMGDGDLVVSREPVFALSKEFERVGVSSKVWSLEKPAAHSLMSPYDEPFVKPWLNGLTDSAMGFLAKSVYLNPAP